MSSTFFTAVEVVLGKSVIVNKTMSLLIREVYETSCFYSDIIKVGLYIMTLSFIPVSGEYRNLHHNNEVHYSNSNLSDNKHII